MLRDLADALRISIHALREEGDQYTFCAICTGFVISIHALREEGDRYAMELVWHKPDFYPRPPRGGRRTPARWKYGVILFLSTPSARRATNAACRISGGQRNFYPRPPRGGRHLRPIRRGRHGAISIHALREEGDVFGAAAVGMPSISIHALREEGDFRKHSRAVPYRTFLSTPSARRATLHFARF